MRFHELVDEEFGADPDTWIATTGRALSVGR